MKKIAIGIVLAAFVTGGLWAQSAEEILSKLDKVQTFDTMKSLGTMAIADKLGTRKTEFINHARGKDDSFMEFTSAAEKGQKILRTAKELYLFFPNAEEITRLQGAALRQSMAGSDISYEDMTGNRNRSQNYTPTLVGAENVDGRDAWHLKLEAKTKNVAYPKQEIWVDKANFLPVIVRNYALSGKLLKEIHFSDVINAGGFPYSTKLSVQDKLKTGTSTELTFRNIEINKPLPSKIFSLENLSW